jgi:hypothetical protein
VTAFVNGETVFVKDDISKVLSIQDMELGSAFENYKGIPVVGSDDDKFHFEGIIDIISCPPHIAD